MNIVITGCHGQLGTAVSELLQQQSQYKIFALSHQNFDITQADAIQQLGAIDLIINAAAYTNVEQAEIDTEAAVRVNYLGPKYLAAACAAQAIPLIHVSTDYVFDGSASSPYRENATCAPLNVYGKSKLAGELAVAAGLPQHVILRSSWVYSHTGNNFVKTVLQLAKERSSLQMVADQTGCPTSAQELAVVIAAIVERIASQTMPWGTFHYTAQPATTWFEFATAILDVAREYDDFVCHEVLPIKTQDYPFRAQRPLYSVLNCDKIRNTLGIEPANWHNCLDETIQRMYT